jgi:ATP/ADP translocase
MLTKKNRAVFTIFLLSMILSYSVGLFQFAYKSMAFSFTSADLPKITLLKNISIIPQIFLVALLLFVSKWQDLSSRVKNIFWLAVGLITGLIVLFIFKLKTNSGEFSLVWQSLIINWEQSLTYILSKVFNFTFFSVLIWGMINQLATLSGSSKYYIVIASAFGILGNLTTLFVHPFIFNIGPFFSSSSPELLSVILTGLIFLVVGLLVCYRMWGMFFEDGAVDRVEEERSSFPFLSVGYLVAACAIVGELLGVLFKSQLRVQISDPSTYSKAMGAYNTIASGSTILFFIVFVVLGTWAFYKKGWHATAVCGVSLVILGGHTHLGAALFTGSMSISSQGIYNGFLIAVSSLIFFPLIQILYLYLPLHLRFRTKVITEMIIFPIMTSCVSFILIGVFKAFGTRQLAFVMVAILAVIFMVLLVPSVWYIRRRFLSV